MAYQKIDPDTFEREWRALYDSVFSGQSAEERPFRDPTWEIFLVPHGSLNIERNVFDAIAKAAQEVGDDQVMIKDAEIISPPEPAVIIPWSYSALIEVRDNSFLGHFETRMFARSALWGAACSYEDFSCLGGVPAFMSTVAQAMGGRQVIRATFLDYAYREWGAKEDFRRKVLKSVGWYTS